MQSLSSQNLWCQEGRKILSTAYKQLMGVLYKRSGEEWGVREDFLEEITVMPKPKSWVSFHQVKGTDTNFWEERTACARAVLLRRVKGPQGRLGWPLSLPVTGRMAGVEARRASENQISLAHVRCSDHGPWQLWNGVGGQAELWWTHFQLHGLLVCHKSPGQDHSELLITLLFPAGPWKLTRELAVPGRAPPDCSSFYQ